MTDAVAVFPPGYRLTDSTTGAVMSGATLEFYDAGTTTPKTVYADSDLLTTLGTTIETDALGYPTSDGTAKTMIYVGPEPYKIVIKNSIGTEIATHDNLKGAVSVVDPGDLTIVATRPVVTKSLNYTILSTDQSSVIAGNCSAGDVTFTLPSAVTVGDGWFVSIQHAGTANQVIVVTTSSQTIADGALSWAGSMPLALSGESVTLVSDGGNWRVEHHTTPHIKNAQGILIIADRAASAPGSPQAGALYIVTSTGTWGGVSVTANDVAQYTGASWVKYTPGTDAGWIAYVQDEDLYYRFIATAWRAETASTTAAGIVELATDAEVVTATDTARAVVPASIKFNPGVAKVLGTVAYSGGTPTLQSGSLNITSITDTATGRLTVTIDNDFANQNYIIVAMAMSDDTTNPRVVGLSDATQAVGSFELCVRGVGGTLVDPSRIYIAAFGTLA